MIPTDVGTLTLLDEFLSPAEEQVLITHISAVIPPQQPFRRKRQNSRNAVQRWGSAMPYANGVISSKIPAHFTFLLDRLMAQNLVEQLPDSITMNQYLQNQIIPPHIDDSRAGPVITVLSLATPATMVFTNEERSFSVELPPRSLVQMRDEIRYNWKHEILPVADTRYSLVFRCSRECFNK